MDTIKINKGNVKMIAHRGLSGIEKENTNTAFVAAGNRSYYGIETDVHKTLDGKYVIIHDSDTIRVGLDCLSIENSTFDTIRGILLTQKNGVKGRTDIRIPSLQEYLQICKCYEKVCVLELKGTYTKEQVNEIVGICRHEEYLDSVIFISFSLQNLQLLREDHPDLPAQFLTGKFTDDLIDILISIILK